MATWSRNPELGAKSTCRARNCWTTYHREAFFRFIKQLIRTNAPGQVLQSGQHAEDERSYFSFNGLAIFSCMDPLTTPGSLRACVPHATLGIDVQIAQELLRHAGSIHRQAECEFETG
jgi:hypothetical protein